MSKPSKIHMGAAKQLLRYLAEAVNFSIIYKREGFKLAAYPDVSCGNNPDSSKSMYLYIVIVANGPINFKVGLQGLTAQPAMEVELVAAALTMKEAVFFSNVMVELGFQKGFSSVPLYLDNISMLHVAGNRTYSPRARHIALGRFFLQELVEEGKIHIRYLNTQDELPDLGTKSQGRHHHLPSSNSSTTSKLEL